MVAHDFVAPKTDGTFKIPVQWNKLSKSSVPVPEKKLPFTPPQPVTLEELQTKTVGEWMNWKKWRKHSPLANYSPKGLLANYLHKNAGGKFISGKMVFHWFVAVAATGCILNYGRNSHHLYAKHH